MIDSSMMADVKKQAAGRAGGIKKQRRFRRHVDWLRGQLDQIGKMETGNRNKCEVYVMIREVMLEIKKVKQHSTASR